MNKSQEQFENETGLQAKIKMQRYAGDQFGPVVWNDAYIEWLEERYESEQETINAVTNSSTYNSITHKWKKE